MCFRKNSDPIDSSGTTPRIYIINNNQQDLTWGINIVLIILYLLIVIVLLFFSRSSLRNNGRRISSVAMAKYDMVATYKLHNMSIYGVLVNHSVPIYSWNYF